MLNQQLNLVAIPGYEGYYASKTGSIYSSKTNRFLKPTVTTKGYLKVCLTINKKEKTCFVHRLVSITFLDNPENKPHVNHIDSNKQNNNVTNLEWCTPSENQIHDYNFKKDKRVRKNNYSGLRDSIREEAIKYLLTGLNFVEVSKLLKVSPNTIGVIAKESSETKENSYRKYKLSKEKVSEIFNLLKQGVTQNQIALLYNVDPTTISKIKKGLFYKYVTCE